MVFNDMGNEIASVALSTLALFGCGTVLFIANSLASDIREIRAAQKEYITFPQLDLALAVLRQEIGK